MSRLKETLNTMRRILTLSVALGLAFAASARADLINLIPNSTYKSPGNVVRGTVVAETPTEVKVRVGNAEQSVPVSQIASIRYDGSPGSMALAQSRESAGNLVEAADNYKKAAADSATKPFILEDALFNQARVSADLGLTDPAKTDAAITLLDAFLKAHSNGRHAVPALESLAKLQMQKGSFDAVALTIDRLSKIPDAADRAAVLRAKVASRKGDHTSSISELDSIISNAPEGSAKKRDAQLTKAESLAAMKKYAEAESLVRGVIKAAPAEDFATQALAHNTLGDCLRAAGRPRDAMFAYLHTDLLFFKDKEEHPKALAKIIQLWREQNRPERADEVMERLKQEYPRSPYTAAATKPTS
jgi:tetratricopeptide (TPR) repeat protein